MFEKLSTFLSPFKLYLYAIVTAILVCGWLFDRHSRYMAGIGYCVKQQQTAQSEYEQRREKKNEEENHEAVQKADKAAKQIADLEHEKALLLSKLDDSSCALTDYERLQFNEALSRLQGK